MINISIFKDFQHEILLIGPDGRPSRRAKPRYEMWAFTLRRAYLGCPVTSTVMTN